MAVKGSVLGIALMILASLAFVVTDALSKIVSIRVLVPQIIFAQASLVVILFLAIILIQGKQQAILVKSWRWQSARAALTALAMILYFSGLRELPLSLCVAIAFANPIFVTVLAALLLKECPSLMRWAATLAGFCGVLLIVNPAGDVSLAVVYPLLAAVCIALRDLVTQKMVDRESLESMIVWSSTGTAIAAILIGRGDIVPTIGVDEWLILLGSGVAYLAGLYLVIESIRHAELSLITPFRYTALLWAGLLDLFVWQVTPSWNALVGSAIVLVAAIFVYRTQPRPIALTDRPAG